MHGCMTHYYFFKDIVNDIPSVVKERMEYSNDTIFNMATFNDLGIFYKLLNPLKKDRYQLEKHFHNDDFLKFFYECLINNKKENNYQALLLSYAMISHYLLDNDLERFLARKVSRKYPLDQALNNLDVYFAAKYEQIDLHKTNLKNKFSFSFSYDKYMDKLIHDPLIKCLNFLCSERYFSHSMKCKSYYYDHLVRSKTKIKVVFFYLYDFIFNHRSKPKAHNYLYPSKVDTTLLNINKAPYLIGEDTYNYSLEEVIALAKIKSLKWIEAINDFYFNDNEKKLLKLFDFKEEIASLKE